MFIPSQSAQSWSTELELAIDGLFTTPEKTLPVMDRKNVRMMVNLTGGAGAGLEEAIEKFQRSHPGRFVTFAEPPWDRTNQPDYSKMQADAIERAKTPAREG
jgi:hypothetical protein